MKTKTLNTALIAAGVLAVGTAGAFSLNPGWLDKAGAAPAPAAAAQGNGGVQAGVQTAALGAAAAPAAVPMMAASGQVPNYRAIVQQFGPAVVGITVAGTHTPTADEQGGARGLPPGLEDDPFFQFYKGIPGFGQRGPRGPGGMPQQPFRGQGSGFIISEDGLILTNAHVVRDAKDVTVKLGDRREFPAKVLGLDPVTDVAVLRIEAKGLPTVRLGDPKQIDVGDPVLAIGAPFGFEQSATQGIVSAKGRSLPGDAVVPFIQTDAAVNPGNSGGPLFSGNGEVVGINAQIYSHTGGYQGLAFAIPIDVALKVKDQIVATGKASHGRLGVTIQDMNQGLAESFGLKRPDGALVAQVAPGSAAAAAGLKPGDVITHVNGELLTRSGALSSAIGMAKPGDTVKLGVWRDHKALDVEARLGSAAPSDEAVAAAGDAAQGPRLGLSLRPLQPGEKQQSGLPGGLVVEQVSGAAERAGIEAGDVLLAINGKPVNSIEQIRGVLKSQPKSVALLVQRQGNQIFVPVPLG
ncbi:MAG TPA: Do family serine endopeptidase [Rubrivivax sp.]|nr:Do family serine endopeptidase [Rubrivivax sp.]